MIDAEIQDGQITKRYIFINLRAVALIEYDNEQHNGSYSDSASGNKNAGYSQNNAQVGVKIYAIHTDHLGTPLAITDSTQALVWRSEYATFGKATVQARVLESEGKTAENKKAKNSFGIISTANASEGAASGTKAAKPFEFNLRFAGQYEDTESGYHYNWHRYYDPSTGRYLTPDPIGLAGGLNGYGYAGQDPMGAVDPWGLYTVYWGGAGLDGPYIPDQVKALLDAGLTNVKSSNTGGGGSLIMDANAVINLRSYPPKYGYFTPKAPYDTCPTKTSPNEQTNYIGYSYGSLLAAQAAMYYANQGQIIDNLVLIGSPIDADFLAKLKANKNIKNVIVKDLGFNGDPIKAGMSDLDLLISLPTLGKDVLTPGAGHFYYAPDNQVGKDRRSDLAKDLYNLGLR